VHLAGGRGVILPAPVVDAVGHVGELLDLGYHQPASGRVHGTGLDEEEVTLLRSHYVQHLLEGSGGAAVEELAGIYILVESHVDTGRRVGLEDVPGLGLAVGVVPVEGRLVVRMHLDGKPLLDIEQLDQDGELVAETLVVVLPDYLVHVGLDDIEERVVLQPAAFYHGTVVLKAGNLPTLAYHGVGIEGLVKLSGQTAASPDSLLGLGYELNGIYRLFHCNSCFLRVCIY